MAKQETELDFRWRFAALAFLSMIVGMAANSGYNHVTGIIVWDWHSFLAPIIISPIVFNAFISVIKSEIDILTGLLISF